ncbi:MAG: HEAT repeat domain-containing protein, partial [Candidatus Thorarchaeota archaeon]
PRVIKPLIQALNDPNPRVISAAANSLGAQGITQASTPIFECFIRCRTAWQLIRAAGYKEDEMDEDYSTSKVQEYQDLQRAAAHCLNALVRLQATRFGPMLAEMISELDWILEDGPTDFQVSLTRALRMLVHDKDPELKRRLKWMEEAIADESKRQLEWMEEAKTHEGKGRNFFIKD